MLRQSGYDASHRPAAALITLGSHVLTERTLPDQQLASYCCPQPIRQRSVFTSIMGCLPPGDRRIPFPVRVQRPLPWREEAQVSYRTVCA